MPGESIGPSTTAIPGVAATRTVSTLGGAMVFALMLGGCGKAATPEDCLKAANEQRAQDRQRLSAKVNEIKASHGGDSLKDQEAFRDLMVEVEGAENRYKVAIRNCNAQDR